jgi:hypothetical protein
MGPRVISPPSSRGVGRIVKARHLWVFFHLCLLCGIVSSVPIVSRCGPQRRSWFPLWATVLDLVRPVVHGAESGSALLVQNLVPLCAPLRWIWFRAACAESGPRCGPWRRIWFPAVGHGAESGSPLWAMVENLVSRCGPWCRIWFPAVGHGGESGFSLWAMVQNLVPRCGPWCRIWFPTLDHSANRFLLWTRALNLLPSCQHGAESGTLLWPAAQNLIPSCGPRRRIWFPLLGHGAESGYLLWASRHRIWFPAVGDGAESEKSSFKGTTFCIIFSYSYFDHDSGVLGLYRSRHRGVT